MTEVRVRNVCPSHKNRHRVCETAIRRSPADQAKLVLHVGALVVSFSKRDPVRL